MSRPVLLAGIAFLLVVGLTLFFLFQDRSSSTDESEQGEASSPRIDARDPATSRQPSTGLEGERETILITEPESRPPFPRECYQAELDEEQTVTCLAEAMRRVGSETTLHWLRSEELGVRELEGLYRAVLRSFEPAQAFDLIDRSEDLANGSIPLGFRYAMPKAIRKEIAFEQRFHSALYAYLQSSDFPPASGGLAAFYALSAFSEDVGMHQLAIEMVLGNKGELSGEQWALTYRAAATERNSLARVEMLERLLTESNQPPPPGFRVMAVEHLADCVMVADASRIYRLIEGYLDSEAWGPSTAYVLTDEAYQTVMLKLRSIQPESWRRIESKARAMMVPTPTGG